MIVAHEYEAGRIVFSPNNGIVALSHSRSITKEESVIAVWTPMGEEIARELGKGIMDDVYCITFSKSGRYIASGYRKESTLFWDVESR